MRYQGGKAKIGKRLAEVIIPTLKIGTGNYAEPFVGAAGVAQHIAPHALSMSLSDASEDLILMWAALMGGWQPPREMSEERYQMLKGMYPCPERAFAGYGCSFAGKWFGGYARDATGTDYAGQAARGLLAKTSNLNRCPRVSFTQRSYEDLDPHAGQVIYCDPPYANTLQYSRVGKFDSARFWEIVDRWDWACAFVFVSEFKAPPGWIPVWAKPQDGSMRGHLRDMTNLDQLFCTPTTAQLLGLKDVREGTA